MADTLVSPRPGLYKSILDKKRNNLLDSCIPPGSRLRAPWDKVLVAGQGWLVSMLMLQN